MIHIDKYNSQFTGEYIDLYTEITMIIGSFYATLKRENKEELAEVFKETLIKSMNDDKFWALCDRLCAKNKKSRLNK